VGRVSLVPVKEEQENYESKVKIESHFLKLFIRKEKNSSSVTRIRMRQQRKLSF
jgi:hypothetical protein